MAQKSKRDALARRLFGLAVGAVFGAIAATGAHAEPRLATVTAEDLNGRELTLPAELPGERTLLLIAFKREQQLDLNVWIAELGLKESGAPAWLELPVIANYGALWRDFVDNGMRSGITTTEDRARVVTIYGDVDAFRGQLGLGSEDLVYLLVVDRAGAVLAREYGAYSAEKAARLLAAMDEG